MGETKHIAVDIGHSAIKMAMMTYDGKKVTYDKFIRLPITNLRILGRYYINIYEVFHDILEGMIELSDKGRADTIGIDTWGCDYGLIDKHGELLGSVYFHKDRRTANVMDRIFEKITPQEYFCLTGGDANYEYNFPQLYSQVLKDRSVLERTDKLLLFPDLILYMLTGEMGADDTMAGQSQLLNRETGGWNYELLDMFDIPKEIFPTVRPAGHSRGRITEDLKDEYGFADMEAISVAGHDTASAIAAVYGLTNDDVFISAGSHIILGATTDGLILSEEARIRGYKNLPGAFGKNMFYRDINGFWIINECLRMWRLRGKNYNYMDLEEMLLVDMNMIKSVIDTDSPEISACSLDMPGVVKKMCADTGQQIPESDIQVFAVILRSLAVKIVENLKVVETLTGRETKRIYLLSGGSQSTYFAKVIAEVSGKEVWIGRPNSTVYGNVLMQIVALEGITDIAQAEEIMQNSYKYRIIK